MEGALGSISKTTNKAPRQAIEIVPSASEKSFAKSSRLNELACIEKFYDAVLCLEELFRKKIPEKEDEIALHEEKIANAKTELWKLLTSANDSFEKGPHPLIRALSFKKGIHVICRALGLVEQKQCLGFFSLLFTRLESLEVCNISLGTKSPAVDYFLETLFPILGEVVSESPLSVICAMVQIILERHNLLWVANSRVGLEMLTLFLSKAELLKSSDTTQETELAAW